MIFKNRDPFPLSKFPASELDVGGGLPIVGQPRLGDYLHLLAMGKDFYGIFSASNVPDQSRFPYGVTFQRHKDSADQETAGSAKRYGGSFLG